MGEETMAATLKILMLFILLMNHAVVEVEGLTMGTALLKVNLMKIAKEKV